MENNDINMMNTQFGSGSGFDNASTPQFSFGSSSTPASQFSFGAQGASIPQFNFGGSSTANPIFNFGTQTDKNYQFSGSQASTSSKTINQDQSYAIYDTIEENEELRAKNFEILCNLMTEVSSMNDNPHFSTIKFPSNFDQLTGEDQTNVIIQIKARINVARGSIREEAKIHNDIMKIIQEIRGLEKKLTIASTVFSTARKNFRTDKQFLVHLKLKKNALIIQQRKISRFTARYSSARSTYMLEMKHVPNLIENGNDATDDFINRAMDT